MKLKKHFILYLACIQGFPIQLLRELLPPGPSFLFFALYKLSTLAQNSREKLATRAIFIPF